MPQIGGNLQVTGSMVGENKRLVKNIRNARLYVDVRLPLGESIVENAEVAFLNFIDDIVEETRSGHILL